MAVHVSHQTPTNPNPHIKTSIEGLMPIVMSIPVYFLLLTFPETSTALSEREQHIAINRFGRGATRKTDVTWSWPVFFNVLTRPLTIIFFIAYVCVLIVAASLGTFLPVIFNTFLNFSSTKSNIYTSAIYLVAILEYALWSAHSDHTRERMWHYLLPIMIAIPCFAVWTHVSIYQSYGSIKPISLYGLAFLGKSVSISQPVALAYRSATLYGATEQAVGGAVAVASLSIASIIGPQIFPHADSLWYLPGFSASLGTLSCTILLYASLPFWFLWEARRRMARYGHAMPLRALEDAGNALVSEAAREQEEEQVRREEKGGGGLEGGSMWRLLVGRGRSERGELETVGERWDVDGLIVLGMCSCGIEDLSWVSEDFNRLLYCFLALSFFLYLTYNLSSSHLISKLIRNLCLTQAPHPRTQP